MWFTVGMCRSPWRQGLSQARGLAKPSNGSVNNWCMEGSSFLSSCKWQISSLHSQEVCKNSCFQRASVCYGKTVLEIALEGGGVWFPINLWFCLFVCFAILGFEFRISGLLGKCSNTLATPTILLLFQIGSHAWTGLRPPSSYLHLQRSCDYRPELIMWSLCILEFG
jgi:hypothetical protein